MVIAGRGPVPHDQQPQSTYRITHDDKHRCYTNEIHVMNITTHEGINSLMTFMHLELLIVQSAFSFDYSLFTL